MSSHDKRGTRQRAGFAVGWKAWLLLALLLGFTNVSGSTTTVGTGNFHVKNGAIIDPNGNTWRAFGINVDVEALITDIQNNLPKTIFFQAWSAGSSAQFDWSIASMTNVPVAVANPYSLVRENLGRPTVGGGSGGGTTRSPFNIPLASNSVWNIGIGSNAQWGVNTDADVRSLHTLGGTLNNAINNFAGPIWFGQQSDPLVSVTGKNFVSGTNVAIQMHVPSNAIPGQDSDAEINLYDSTQKFAFTGSNPCTFNNGSNATGGISCGIGNIWDITGDGVTQSTNFGGHTISGGQITPGNLTACRASGVCDVGQLLGIITAYDLSVGAINHMVRLSLPVGVLLNPGVGGNNSPTSDGCNGGTGGGIGVPWPNFCADGFSNTAYQGNILAGSTFGIPASVHLNAQGFTQGGLMLARALQKYGALWRDAGGSSNVIFTTEVPATQGSPLIAQMQQDVNAIVQLMSIMRNQSPPGPNGTGVVGRINGGGTYPTPLPPVCIVRNAPTIAAATCSGGSGTPIPANKICLCRR